MDGHSALPAGCNAAAYAVWWRIFRRTNSDALDTLPQPREVVRRLSPGNEYTTMASPTTANADSLNGNIFYSAGLNYCFKVAPGRSVWQVMPFTCGCSISTCSSCRYETCGSLSYDAGKYAKTVSRVQWFTCMM